jgi:hypothetical protein
MKTRLLLLASLFATSLLFLSSCEPVDPEGTTEDRDKFVDSWTCTESNRKVPAYWVEISEDPTLTNQVVLKNFGQLGNSALPNGSVSGDYITVPQQYTLDDNSWQVEGDGVMVTNNSIDWNYELNDGTTLYQITAVYERN